MKFYKSLNSNGLTLVEVIASIAILSIILLAFMNFFNQTILSSSKVEQNLSAVNIADRILYEFELNTDLSTITSDCSTPFQSSLTFLQQDIDGKRYYEVNNQKYYPTISVCQTTDEQELNIYRVNIKVYDKDYKLLSEIFDYIS